MRPPSLGAMAALAASLLTLAGAALASDADGNAAPRQFFSEYQLIVGKTADREECAGTGHAVWVEHALGTECIRYYPSDGLDFRQAGSPRTAALFFHGDRLAGKTPLANYGKASVESLTAEMQKLHREHGVPFIYVARPGVFGSSGDHAQRRRPKEFHSLNAAVDAIKARYGLDRVVLAGQSGGATSVAAILTLGRTDVKCAVPASGGYAVNELAEIKRFKAGQAPRRGCDVTNYCDAYDVIEHIDGIAADPRRSIFLIGDPQDRNTVFELQQKFADAVRAAGHQLEIIEAEGKGPDRHSLSHVAYRVAGECAKGMTARPGGGRDGVALMKGEGQ